MAKNTDKEKIEKLKKLKKEKQDQIAELEAMDELPIGYDIVLMEYKI